MATTSDLTFTLLGDKSGYSVKAKSTSISGDLVIPAEYKGLPVTSISDNAFSGCSKPTLITIPSSVTSIGNSAFKGCKGLTSITIPSSVTSIGDGAFDGCSSFTSITVESGNTVYHSNGNCCIRTADNTLVFGCKNSVIPEYVTSIGNYAFSSCSGLTSVTIPSSVTSIGNYSFYYCSGLTSIKIPSSVTSIGERAFSGCRKFTSITIPSSVTRIDNYTFSSCSGLTSVTIPSSVTSIGNYAFYGCSGLTSIKIPSSVTSIDKYAFRACTKLTSITIPSSVTVIGDYVINECTSLTSITVESGNTVYHSNGNCCIRTADNTLVFGCKNSVIPDYVTNIGNYAFSDCKNLTSISIPSSVTSIGDNAFYYCSGLTSITIPSSVTSIGDLAFRYCKGLTSINIPSSMTSIGNYVFNNCTSLTSITIPSSITTIGNFTFSYCNSLTSITIPSSVTRIGSSAFSYCKGLKYFKFEGNAIDEKQHGKLYNTPNLSCVYVNHGTTGWGETWGGKTVVIDPESYLSFTLSSDGTYYSVKAKNTSISGDLEIPAEYNGLPVTNISDNAFSNLTGLTSITIPSSVTTIGVTSFNNCSGLISITVESGNTVYHSNGNCCIRTADNTLVFGCKNSVIPEYVVSVGERAFFGCTDLTSITIPSSVNNIGDRAFRGCTGLASIIVESGNTVYHSDGNCCIRTADNTLVFGCKNSVIPDYVTTIGSSAFDYCSDLISITIPSSVTSIKNSAFSYCTGLTSITIKSGVTSIGSNAFSYTGLTSITIPSSVTTIGGLAFWRCTSLKYFKFEGNAITESTSVLNNTPNLQCVYINPDATGWGSTWGGKPVVIGSSIGNAVKYGETSLIEIKLGEITIYSMFIGDDQLF